MEGIVGPLLIFDIKTDATQAAGSNLVDPHWGDPYPGITDTVLSQTAKSARARPAKSTSRCSQGCFKRGKAQTTREA